MLDAIQRSVHAGVTCLTGVSSGERTIELNVGAANRRIVLENDVVFGSVDANHSHYETTKKAFDAADPTWLSRLLTRRIPLDSWTEGSNVASMTSKSSPSSTESMKGDGFGTSPTSWRIGPHHVSRPASTGVLLHVSAPRAATREWQSEPEP